MKHKLALLVILALTGLVLGSTTALAQYTGQRVPLGILVTNWDCGPCAPVNQILDDYIPTMGNDVALIRVHCWWPGDDDPIFGANEAQSEFLVYNTPGGADFAPHMWMDNSVDLSYEPENMIPGYTARLEVPSPLEITVDFGQSTQTTYVGVDILDPMPDADYRLFAAITEDNIFASGSNGEDYHNQAFRRLYPDTEGLPVDNVIGLQEFAIPTEINSRWVYDNCRTTVYVQNMTTGEIQNAATMFVNEGTVTAAPRDVAALSLPSIEAYPNPFNPTTRLKYEIREAGPVTVLIHDLSGRVVRTLVDGYAETGQHETTWQGRDDAGLPVASGVYLARLRSADGVSSRKLVLAK